MTNWFDENNLPKSEPEEKDQPRTEEEKGAESAAESDGETSGSPLGNEFAESGGNTGDDRQPGDPIPPIPPIPPFETSWYSPNGTSYQNQNGSNTYHYGVNAQNQVPNSTNNYYQPYHNQNSSQNGYNPQGGQNPQGGYNPQNGYNPYGSWQRMPQQDMQQNGQPGMPDNGQLPKPPKKKKSGASVAIATLSVICAGAIVTLSVLLAVALSENGVNKTGETVSGKVTTSTNANAPAMDIKEDDPDAQGLSTRSIVQKNLNSTVVITIYDRQTSFYGGDSQPQEVGAASGIVMSADGYIITNWHVVINESTGRAYERIDVKTYDGTVYKNAEVVGYDKDTDLAVIHVGAAKLTVPEFGDSAALKLGDKVVAIGNAGGLAWTTTQGIVSGLARDVYEDTGYAIQCLQIDAAINPGNSGGPLLNAQGQVVGVNSAKIVAQGYEGLGFSIPIKEAKTIIDDLVKYGFVKNRVVLGITGRDITQPGYEGFQIQEISSNSSLAGTNARVGDIITKINNTAIKSGTELRNELSKLKVGDKCTITLMRVDRSGSRETFTITCTLKEYQG